MTYVSQDMSQSGFLLGGQEAHPARLVSLERF